MWRTVLVVVAVVAVVVSEVDSNSDQGYIKRHHRPRQQCSGFCKASSKFELLKGQTYVYQYEGVVSTGVEGVGSDTSVINVTAEAHLRVEDSPCDLTLLVRNARLYDSGPSGLEKSPHQSEWATRLEEWPLRLSYQDGRVDQLCPAAEELSWVLDFKRALLSALQNSMPDLSSNTHLHERDVSGTCETTYTVSSNMFGDMEVLRRKDLHSCSGRGPHTLGLSGALPSSTPIVRSEQICRQKVSDNHGRHISRVECFETHVFSPFSNGQAGLRTQANLTLTLANIVKSEEGVNTDLFVNRRTSLKGEFAAVTPEVYVSDSAVESTLQELSSYSQQGVDEHVPSLFDELVHQMTMLDDQQLVKIFDKIEEKRMRKFFLDALPLVGTSGSVKAMYQISKAREVSWKEMESWLSALAFHKQPTLEMLNTLNVIMQEEGYHTKVWLAVGAVVHSYCQHDTACQDTPEVKSIMAHFSFNLGQSCHTTDKDQQHMVVATLKAVGNAGIIPSLDVLQNCFLNEDNALEVRLAALSATRRMSCNLQDQLPFMRIYLNRDLDSELRIAAYLAAMQCPSSFTLSQIRESLQMDDVNQVLSFVWTHLTNLQESKSRWKKEIREMLHDVNLANKFKTDARKFSRNYEMSVYSDVLKMGATVDSNVLFSTKSYLPRSANLNLTIDLFGEALNLFEVGTRLEGFESMVEDLFSPTGYFPDESLQKMVKNMRPSENDKNEVIQSMAQKFNKGIKDEPQGLIFARVFGNELYLTQFSSLETILGVKKPKKYTGQFVFESLKSLFDHKKIDYTKSFRVLNSQYTLPTVVGLPLRVQVNGTAAVSFEMKTDLDVQQILKTKSGDISLFINPSAVLEVDGKMTVDAVFAQAGVETKGNLKTNTYIDLKMSVDKGKVLDVMVNVPRKKAEVIDVMSVVYVRQRERLIELGGVGELTQWDSCHGTHVPTLSGMRICSTLVVRNASDVLNAPYFPLTGRFHYSLGLEKSDNFNAYHLHVERNFESSRGNNEGKFLVELNTPGSKLNRMLSAKVSFSSEGSSVDASLALVSPFASVDMSGQLVMTEAEMALDIKTQVGNSQVVATRMGVRREISDQNIRLEPSLIVQSEPWDINFNMSGHLNIAAGTHYSAGLTVQNPAQIFSFAGEVTKDTNNYSGTVSLNTAGMDVSVNGRLVNTPSLFSCKAQANYKLVAGQAQDIEFVTKLQSNFKQSLTKRHLGVSLQMSEWPQFNSKASWVLHQGNRYFDSRADVTVGRTQWKPQLTYINNLNEPDKSFEFTINLASPTKRLDYKAQIIYKVGDEFVHAHALAQLSKETRFISLLDYKREADYERGMSLLKLDLELASPWNRAAVEAKLDTPFTFHAVERVNGTAVFKWGDIEDPQWLSVGGKYLLTETAKSVHHRLEGWMEGREWATPLRLEGDWLAKSEGGLIHSLLHLNVSCNTNSYNASAHYIKDPSLGKHDLKMDLALPDNSYSSSFLVINNFEIKNITFQLDLEKTLYFTSQLQGDEQLQMQLFWDYLEDQSQNVLVQYKMSGLTELAIISMPGHYASLTIDRLGRGLSAMNITAVWGESKGSASNAILLSTYWMLDTDQYDWPTVHTKIHLSTPFIGFEHQSFEFHMNGSSHYYGYPLTKGIYVSTRWQDQFVDLNFNQISTMNRTKFFGKVSSTLELMETVAVQFDFIPGKTYLDSIIINVAYNKQASLVFSSVYTGSELGVRLILGDTVENTAIFSGNLTVNNHVIQLKATLPENKHIYFNVEYNFPSKFEVNLMTPFDGYEVASLQYHIRFDDNNIKTKLVGKTGKQFAMFSAIIDTLETGFNGKLNISSSSHVPDITVILKHEFSLSKNGVHLEDFASIVLAKNERTIQSGHALISFKDDRSSSSSNTKSLQTVLQLPGHYSSSNYSYQTQVKLTGVEVQHSLTHIWNTEKTEVSMLYEGLTFISGFLKRNDQKKAVLYFKNSNNQAYKTEVILPGDYYLQHRLYISSWNNWENMFTVFTPNKRMVIKNAQTLNAERTDYVHKTTFFLNKEFSYIDLIVNVDAESGRVNSVMFSTTTPFSDPVTAKYNLVESTELTSKHAVELKFQQNKEVRAVLDVTSSDSEFEASFNLFSPFSKKLGGSVRFEFHEVNLKAESILMMDDNRVSVDMELTRNPKNAKIELHLNDTSKNILHISCSYDVTNKKKEATLKSSYFEHIVNLNGHYTLENNQVQAGLIANSPFDGWKEMVFEFDAILSQKHSVLKINFEKEGKFVLFLGTGTFQRNLIKTDFSLDYLLIGDRQKHSASFETSRGEGSGLVAFQLKNNEVNIVDISIEGSTQSEIIDQKKVYMLNYKSITPLEHFQTASVQVKYTCDEIKCELNGNTGVNSWQAFFKGESTLNKDAVGFVGFELVGNGETISGAVSISNITDGLNVSYSLQSSVSEFRTVNGNLSIESKPTSFNVSTFLAINEEKEYAFSYNTIFDVSKSNLFDNYRLIRSKKFIRAEHTLKISLPFEGFENIIGNLEYGSSLKRDDEKIEGNIAIGNKTYSLHFYHTFNEQKSFNASVDLPNILSFKVKKNKNGMKVTANTVSNNIGIYYFSLNLTFDKSDWMLNITKDNSKLHAAINFQPKKITIFGEYNNQKINAVAEKLANGTTLEITSNIPKWREMSIITSYDDKLVVSITKEKQITVYIEIEYSYRKRSFLLTMPTIFISIGASFDYSSKLLKVHFNVSGMEQNFDGTVSLLQDSAQVSLATPIQGFEDLTLIGNLNRNDKTAGLIFYNKEKRYELRISMSVENSKTGVLQGSILIDKDEFTFSIGTQKCTDEEPKSSSIYISVFKNKKTIFWSSLEGYYNLDKKAGIKISFSSYYFDQVVFELLSLKTLLQHNLLLNYVYGSEFVYVFNSTLVKDSVKPRLLIESQLGALKNVVEMNYDNSKTRKTIAFELKQNDNKFIMIKGESSMGLLASELKLIVENKDLLPLIQSINIFSTYNFTKGSFINSSLAVDGIKYFELFMDSNSLYSVNFQSSLMPSMYINHTYNISLVYQLDLPLTTISSDVTINSDVYKCTANFTWENQLAATFFQLTTNAGYGFENAVLSANYKVGEVNSHMMDFVIDESTLFHVACDVSYPSMMSVKLVLPDTLFLPYVKTFSGGYNVTDEEKKVDFHFKSGSNGQSLIDSLILFKKQHNVVNFSMSQQYRDNTSSSAGWSFQSLEDNVDFRTSVVWINDTMFSSFYRKEVPKDSEQSSETLLNILFGLENNYDWNVSAMQLLNVELAGALNASDMSLRVKHPSIDYLNQFGIGEVNFTQSINSTDILKAYYKKGQIHEWVVGYSDFFNTAGYLMETGVKFEVNLTDWVFSVNRESTCEKYIMFGMCGKFKHLTTVGGLAGGLRSLYYEVDLVARAIHGSLSTPARNVTFGVIAKTNPDALPSCNASLYFTSSDMPDQPFSIIFKYDKNGVDRMLYGSLNIFEKDARELVISTEDMGTISKLSVQGKNILYLRDIALTAQFSSTSTDIKGNLDKDNFDMQLKYRRNIYSLELVSSYDALKTLKVTHEMDSSTRHHFFFGVLKIEGSKSFTKWEYFVSRASDRSGIVCEFESDKDVQGRMILNLNDRKEINLQLRKNGKLYEGKGTYTMSNNDQTLSGEGSVSINGKLYTLSVHHLLTSSERKAGIKIKIPTEHYSIEFERNNAADETTPFASVKYKTPIYPFQLGELFIWYSKTAANSREYLQIGEKKMSYDVNYNETVIGVSITTETFKLDDLKLKIIHGGKKGLLFKYLSKKIEILLSHIDIDDKFALNSFTDVEGVTIPALQFLIGKTSFMAYVEKSSKDCFASIEMPSSKKILFISESKIDNHVNDVGFWILERTTKLVIGQKTYIEINSLFNSTGQYKGSLHAEALFEKTVNIIYTIQNERLAIDMDLSISNKTIIDTGMLYLSDSTVANKWSGSFQIFVKKFMSVPDNLLINPKVILSREVNDESVVKYKLNFINGITGVFSFNASCSVELPDPQSFLLDLKPLIVSQIDLETVSSEYTVMSNISLQTKKVDASMKWRELDKSAVDKENSEFTYLEFGGLLNDSSVELYFNKNKLTVSLENVENRTNISAYLTTEKLNETYYFVTTIKYSPIFILSISKNFPTPTNINIKVDLRKQSLESALDIVHHGLEQQAFVNVYLDSSPKYAELIYIDIWKQTHEVSVHVDEKDDEVSLRGKINSPALDEYFLIATVGKNNDRFDLNLNDDFVFKAFKDDIRTLFDVHFGNEYKLNIKSDNGFDTSITLPMLTGTMSFKLTESVSTSYFYTYVDVLSNTAPYQFHLGVNTDSKLFDVTLRNGEENILRSFIAVEDNQHSFEFKIVCNVFDRANDFVISHTDHPLTLTVVLNTSYIINTSLSMDLGLTNEKDTNVIAGNFDLKGKEKLISSCLEFNKVNHTLNVTLKVPLFSEMDEAKVSGILHLRRGDLDVNLTASLISANILNSQVNIHLIKNDELFASGLVVNSKFKYFDNLILSVRQPLTIFASDFKSNLVIHLPTQKPYELSLTVSLCKDLLMTSSVIRWQDFISSLEFKIANTPFYSELFEVNLQYMKTKVQIGAWTDPKYPITDHIYFLDVNDRRIVEVSYSLIQQSKHYKSKLILHTAFKGHEKYGIDCELKTVDNSTFGKIVKILASAPQFGSDLGIHFGLNFDSVLNYTLLAQIRIPYNNDIKMARLYSLQQIHPNLNFSKINHSLECTGLGKFGWELSVYGESPYIWKTKMTSIETKIYVNNNVYLLLTKSQTEASNFDLVLEIKTPLAKFNQGSIQFHGDKEITGSGLMVSFNSENIFSINITEDDTSTKEFDIYTQWRSVAMKYLYEVDTKIAVRGYLCWDLDNKETSQFGLSVIANVDNNKYDTGAEIILPSMIIPKLSVKSTFEITSDIIYSLMKVEFPGLNLEGRFLKENSLKFESDITWSLGEGNSKHIGLLSAKKTGVDESKRYFILKHFSLVNDLIITFSTKQTIYGINVQYSPLKEDEISMEFGYWLENRESGLKLVALHPSTNTLIFAVANKTDTDDHTEAGLTVSYLSDEDSSKIKYVEVYGKKNKKTPQLFVGIGSNGNNLAVGGSLWKKENLLQGITLEGRVNQKDPLKLELVQNIGDPGIEMELSYGVSRSYRVAAGMPSSNEITAQLSHTLYGKQNLDALASIRLNTSKILWGKFQLPPLTQIGQELYSGIAAEYSDVNLVSEAIANGFLDFAQEDFSKKAILLLNGISSMTEVLVTQTCVELGVTKQRIEAVAERVKKAYNDDHLYMKSCHLHLKQVCRTLYALVNQVGQVLSSMLDSLLEPVWNIMQWVWKVMESVFSQWMMFASEIGMKGVTPLRDVSQVVAQYQLLRDNIFQQIRLALHNLHRQLYVWEGHCVEWMAQTEVRANQLIESVQKTLERQICRLLNYRDTVLAGFTVLGDTIAEMMEIVVNGVYDIKEVRYAVDTIVEFTAENTYWLTHLNPNVYLRELNMFFDRVVRLVIKDVEKNFGEYEEYFVKAKMVMLGSYEELSRLPEVHYLHATVNHIYHKVKWFWNYADLNQKLKEVMQEFIGNIKEALKELEEMLDEEEGYLKSDYEYSPESNSFMFTQELPFEWRAFNELPYNLRHNTNLNEGPLMSKTQEYLVYVQRVAQSMWQDTKLLPSMLPPFGAIALFTPHNIITFDNTFYHFSSECRSFLLAGDLRHNTFSLIADYHNQNERDLILIVKNMAITIKDNLKVYINDSLVELPTTFSGGYKLSIERKLNSISIESKAGFSLECSSFLNMCKLKLSGWYMGKTAGLLGTYNNEYYDDYNMVENNQEEFIDSWALSPSSCEDIIQINSVPYDIPPMSTRCEQMFLSQSSPLAPCFYVEDPNVFHQMCTTQYVEDSSCTSVYAYISKCAAAGVQLEAPEFCSRNYFNETKGSEYSDTVEVQTQMSADVLFVVESCLYSEPDSTLITRLAVSLASNLEDRHLSQNNFALVSFSGKGVHIHTFNGQLWTHDENQLGTVIRTLEKVDHEMEESQYLSALETAASFPFRPTASKVVVLLHCSECPSASKVPPPLLKSLLDNDAVVHVVQKDNLLNRRGKPVSKVIGFERSGAYLRNVPNKNSPPNPQLLKQITVPQDLCTPLALGTNGTVFSLDKRVKVWASRVVSSALPTASWRLCENTIGYDNVPVWRCRTVSRSHSTKVKDYDQLSVDEYLDTSPSEAYTEYGDVER